MGIVKLYPEFHRAFFIEIFGRLIGKSRARINIVFLSEVDIKLRVCRLRAIHRKRLSPVLRIEFAYSKLSSSFRRNYFVVFRRFSFRKQNTEKRAQTFRLRPPFDCHPLSAYTFLPRFAATRKFQIIPLSFASFSASVPLIFDVTSFNRIFSFIESFMLEIGCLSSA